MMRTSVFFSGLAGMGRGMAPGPIGPRPGVPGWGAGGMGPGEKLIFTRNLEAAGCIRLTREWLGVVYHFNGVKVWKCARRRGINSKRWRWLCVYILVDMETMAF